MVDKALAALCVSFSLRYTDVTCVQSVVLFCDATVTDNGVGGPSMKGKLCRPLFLWTMPLEASKTKCRVCS